MANIKSYPNNQNVYIGAEDVMKWLHGRTSGVFAADNNAAVSAVQGEMAVSVSDGLGWMANAGKDGVVWWNDHEAVNGTKLKVAVDAADSTLNRIDRIIVEWKTTNYVDLPEIKVLKGSLSSNAIAPALTNNSTVRQISLAKINIAAGTTAITASMITDERLDPVVCGLVTEAFTIDTTMVNEQFTEMLDLIERNLKQILGEQIPDESITEEKIADGAVTAKKVGSDVATLDTDGKVKAEQASSTIKHMVDVTAYTLKADDMGKMLLFQMSSGTTTVTIPADADMTMFPLGSEFEVNKWNGGLTVNIVTEGANANTLNIRTRDTNETTSISIGGNYGVVALKRIAASKWLASGDVE